MPLVESAYAWRRLVASLALSTIGGVGLWSVVVVLPAVHSGKYDGSALSNLGSLFSGGAATQDALGAGKGLLESLFGSKLAGVTDAISRPGSHRCSAGRASARVSPG